jgi:hypothetical protein
MSFIPVAGTVERTQIYLTEEERDEVLDAKMTVM